MVELSPATRYIQYVPPNCFYFCQILSHPRVPLHPPVPRLLQQDRSDQVPFTAWHQKSTIIATRLGAASQPAASHLPHWPALLPPSPNLPPHKDPLHPFHCLQKTSRHSKARPCLHLQWSVKFPGLAVQTALVPHSSNESSQQRKSLLPWLKKWLAAES